MSGYLTTDSKKITTQSFREMKQRGEKITMLTAYDFTMAAIVDSSGVDSILVGDSASNVMAGNEDTLPITVDEMIYHARSVKRAVKRALVICDMPFGSYQISREEALRNAVKIMKETGVDAVKVEGGADILDTVKVLIAAGIPVCGHLGLTPAEADQLLADALALDAAGCFAIVLEKVPARLAAKVTKAVSCATIGIGAGCETDGQVLVSADMLGMTNGFRPRFLRLYADLLTVIRNAVNCYSEDVKRSAFPSKDESY